MIEVDKKDRAKIGHLFQNMHDTIILTCLQGHMGRAWTDDLEKPKAALLQVDTFCFVAVEDNPDLIDAIVPQILDLTGLKRAFVISENKMLGDRLDKYFGEDYRKILRYSIKKKTEEFDLEKLRAIVDALPKEYTLYPIDGKWYEESLKNDWSCDFAGNFSSKEDFLNRGIGRIIVHNGEMVSGASSYTIYDEGIEIEIDTREDYRKKGLALVAGAAIILACREKGLYPSWDAANTISVHLAEKLGYEFNQAYDTYMIRKRPVNK